MSLIFQEATHSYFWQGKRVPSVTEILREAGVIRTEYSSPQAMEKGKIIHEILEFMDKGVLLLESVDQRLKGYVGSYEKYKQESKIEILIKNIEGRIYDEEYEFAGTPDRLAVLNKELCIIDIKTGTQEPWHALQLAAYELALKEPVRRFGIYLREDGTYKVKEYTEKTDKNVFIGMLNSYKWKIRNGYKMI